MKGRSRGAERKRGAGWKEREWKGREGGYERRGKKAEGRKQTERKGDRVREGEKEDENN